PADKYKFDKWTNEQGGAEVKDDFVITEALTACANFTDDFAQHEIVPKTDEHQVAPSQNHVLVELKAKANGTVTPNNTDNTTSFWVLKDKQVKFQDVTSKVTVTADEKYKFDKWTNEQTGAEVKDDFVITEALTACANFVPQDSSNPQGSASGTEGGGYSNGLVTMYRLYNPYSHEHLFTTDIMERDNLIPLGWKYELAVGGVYLHGEKGGVYRLYNPTTGEHHYTMDEEELANCVKAGWVNEGVKFFSASEDDGHVVGMVSMYNPYEKAFYHHYTSDEKEIKQMVKDGWIKEDIKWYVAK
ncbi:repeat protein, partial [Fannyhessea vaginae PB189-T1-4]